MKDTSFPQGVSYFELTSFYKKQRIYQCNSSLNLGPELVECVPAVG